MRHLRIRLFHATTRPIGASLAAITSQFAGYLSRMRRIAWNCKREPSIFDGLEIFD
jgi:hypothetical protein